MLETNTLASELKQFRESSSFTSGDPFSFRINISGKDIGLPGKFDPAHYLSNIPATVSGRVAVICPGNGGLCTELLKRGASEVVAFEPRNQFWKPLSAVAKFYAAANDKTFTISDKLPAEDSGNFEMVIWPEALDELRDPLEPLKEILGHLAPQGLLIIELSHGAHGASPAAINSWRPSADAFAETIENISGVSIKFKLEGRNSVRSIYGIQNDKPRAFTSPDDELVVIVDDPETESRADPPLPNEPKTEEAAFANDAASDDNKSAETPVKRRRGRPRKSESKPSAPKRRGRKKKE